MRSCTHTHAHTHTYTRKFYLISLYDNNNIIIITVTRYNNIIIMFGASRKVASIPYLPPQSVTLCLPLSLELDSETIK